MVSRPSISRTSGLSLPLLGTAFNWTETARTRCLLWVVNSLFHQDGSGGANWSYGLFYSSDSGSICYLVPCPTSGGKKDRVEKEAESSEHCVSAQTNGDELASSHSSLPCVALPLISLIKHHPWLMNAMHIKHSRWHWHRVAEAGLKSNGIKKCNE